MKSSEVLVLEKVLVVLVVSLGQMVSNGPDFEHYYLTRQGHYFITIMLHAHLLFTCYYSTPVLYLLSFLLNDQMGIQNGQIMDSPS